MIGEITGLTTEVSNVASERRVVANGVPLGVDIAIWVGTPASLEAAACASTRRPLATVAVVKLEAADTNAAMICCIVANGFACFTSAQKPFIAAVAGDVPRITTTVFPGSTAFHVPEVQRAVLAEEFE